MFTRKFTRKEFVRKGFLAVMVILVSPIFKIFTSRTNISHKDARYYKNLAG